ncbi:hypothetical protein GR223_21120 [Rhizobium leguminosarum]|uniref:hypothetical protein n=1 Tax=Rhizobium ruizarguesonis TaxID=2081791 RepID=UPI0013E0E979|nr:hypothetical protein [Rhizobium ruizarguesonis]NEJ88426.1 hypothetical protein [Rhizobium ruizarguesonis]
MTPATQDVLGSRSTTRLPFATFAEERSKSLNPRDLSDFNPVVSKRSRKFPSKGLRLPNDTIKERLERNWVLAAVAPPACYRFESGFEL